MGKSEAQRAAVRLGNLPPTRQRGGWHSALRRHRYPAPRKNAIPPAGSTLTLESTVDDCATRLATAALSRFLLAVVRFWLLLFRALGSIR